MLCLLQFIQLIMEGNKRLWKKIGCQKIMKMPNQQFSTVQGYDEPKFGHQEIFRQIQSDQNPNQSHRQFISGSNEVCQIDNKNFLSIDNLSGIKQNHHESENLLFSFRGDCQETIGTEQCQQISQKYKCSQCKLAQISRESLRNLKAQVEGFKLQLLKIKKKILQEIGNLVELLSKDFHGKFLQYKNINNMLYRQQVMKNMKLQKIIEQKQKQLIKKNYEISEQISLRLNVQTQLKQIQQILENQKLENQKNRQYSSLLEKTISAFNSQKIIVNNQSLQNQKQENTSDYCVGSTLNSILFNQKQICNGKKRKHSLNNVVIRNNNDNKDKIMQQECLQMASNNEMTPTSRKLRHRLENLDQRHGLFMQNFPLGSFSDKIMRKKGIKMNPETPNSQHNVQTLQEKIIRIKRLLHNQIKSYKH